MRTALLIVACILGLSISTYFTLVYYNFIHPDTKYIPRFCRLEQNVCQRLIFHRDARVFGLPNFILGVVYYCAVLIEAIALSGDTIVLVYASWLTVGLAVYLVYSLIFVVRVMCSLCLLSHVLNTVIAVILTFW